MRIIVGHTHSSFKTRVGGTSFSKSERVVNALGPYQGDQREHRTPQDYVLFELSPILPLVGYRWWLAQALGTLGIVMFEASSEKFGLNTNSAEEITYHAVYSPTHLLALWKAVLKVAETEGIPDGAFRE